VRRVVVTGLGLVTPVGNTVEESWAGLLAGRSGAAPITKFDTARQGVRFACEIKGFDPIQYMDRKEARRYDLFVQYGLGAAQQAVAQSGLEGKFPAPERTGVLIGSGVGGMQTFEDNCRAFVEKGPDRVSPFFVPNVHPRHRRGRRLHPVRPQGPQLRHGLGLCVVGPCDRLSPTAISGTASPTPWCAAGPKPPSPA
jgi:3-oxoacyl-[acyl-carrier-protein] synthase II